MYEPGSAPLSCGAGGGRSRGGCGRGAQLRSANTFVNMDTMQEWIFVAPREHMGTLVAFLEGALETLPCIPATKVPVAAASLAPSPLPYGDRTKPPSYSCWRLSWLGHSSALEAACTPGG